MVLSQGEAYQNISDIPYGYAVNDTIGQGDKQYYQRSRNSVLKLRPIYILKHGNQVNTRDDKRRGNRRRGDDGEKPGKREAD